MADLATLQARKLEAELALHKLATGGQRQTIEYDGRRTTYAAADLDKLRAYVADLQRQIDAATGAAPLGRRPMAVRFS